MQKGGTQKHVDKVDNIYCFIGVICGIYIYLYYYCFYTALYFDFIFILLYTFAYLRDYVDYAEMFDIFYLIKENTKSQKWRKNNPKFGTKIIPLLARKYKND